MTSVSPPPPPHPQLPLMTSSLFAEPLPMTLSVLGRKLFPSSISIDLYTQRKAHLLPKLLLKMQPVALLTPPPLSLPSDSLPAPSDLSSVLLPLLIPVYVCVCRGGVSNNIRVSLLGSLCSSADSQGEVISCGPHPAVSILRWHF